MRTADLAALTVVQVTFTPDGAVSPLSGSTGDRFVFTDEGIWHHGFKTKADTAPGTYTLTMASGDTEQYTVDACVASFVIEP